MALLTLALLTLALAANVVACVINRRTLRRMRAFNDWLDRSDAWPC